MIEFVNWHWIVLSCRISWSLQWLISSLHSPLPWPSRSCFQAVLIHPPILLLHENGETAEVIPSAKLLKFGPFCFLPFSKCTEDIFWLTMLQASRFISLRISYSSLCHQSGYYNLSLERCDLPDGFIQDRSALSFYSFLVKFFLTCIRQEPAQMGCPSGHEKIDRWSTL